MGKQTKEELSGEMEVRRGWRRRGAGQTILPLRSRARLVSNTLSCWYCDFKITAFNLPLFRFGQVHARLLRIWFSMGVGFSIAALLGVAMICAWESAKGLHLVGRNANDEAELGSIRSTLLFGFAPSVSKLGISLADVTCISISSLISVAVHEFGHAAAAASEGIQMEYVAVFLAVVFPGALVAMNSELLQALPRATALRIYCAGVWQNAVTCAVSGSVLFLLPLILFPFYIHGEGPMVLGISSSSPLSGYLSPGDIIELLDDRRIHNIEEWMEITAMKHNLTLQHTNSSEDFKHIVVNHSRKGYCVPVQLIEESIRIQPFENQSACPDEHSGFVKIFCSDPSMLEDGSEEDNFENKVESMHCLAAQDVVKLEKCGDGWLTNMSNKSSCLCSQGEYCLAPVQMPGLAWIEITYSRQDCVQQGKDHLSSSGTQENCGGTFVFVGSMISLAHSVHLTAYRPRWTFLFGTCLPNMLEKITACTFYASLTLALVNSLPVYFLDGESILEVIVGNFTFLHPRKRVKVLQVCLLGGTTISVLTFLRVFVSKFWLD